MVKISHRSRSTSTRCLSEVRFSQDSLSLRIRVGTYTSILFYQHYKSCLEGGYFRQVDKPVTFHHRLGLPLYKFFGQLAKQVANQQSYESCRDEGSGGPTYSLIATCSAWNFIDNSSFIYYALGEVTMIHPMSQSQYTMSEGLITI